MAAGTVSKGEKKGEQAWPAAKILLVYTLFFCAGAALILFWFRSAGKTFISSDDGMKQHYKALVYYGRYLRQIIRTLFREHRLVIPAWDFAIGEGSDILQALHYYVIGDPFAFFTVLVPARFTHIYYDAAILARMWCAGAAFQLLCLRTGRRLPSALLAGSLGYAFCYWNLFTLARHPYFLTPMVFLPLVILGVEQVLADRRPYLFILAVMISALSNIYFFYNIVLITVVYTLLRVAGTFRGRAREGILRLLAVAGYSVLGLAMAAVLFLPICWFFLQDSRMGASFAVGLHFTKKYYAKLPGLFLAPNSASWLCLGYTAPVLLACMLLFAGRRKHTLLKLLFLICLLFVSVPAFGQIFNGLSYESNRWGFCIALLVHYILVTEWEELCAGTRRTGILLLAGALAWSLLCLQTNGLKTPLTRTGIGFLLLAAVLLTAGMLFRGEKKWLRGAMFAVIVLELGANITLSYTPAGKDLPAQTKTAEKVLEALECRDIRAVRRADAGEEPAFFRYSGEVQPNANMLGGISSTQYYWSISNAAVNRFRTDLETVDNISYNYTNYDDRAALETLDAVRYHITKNPDTPAPYGFVRVGSAGESGETGYTVYRNQYELPLLYAYDHALSEENWVELDAAAREEALLQCVMLPTDAPGDSFAPEIRRERRKAEITCGEGVTAEGNTFKVKQKDASVTITFDGLRNAQTYLVIRDLHANKKIKKRTSIFFTAPNGVRRELSYKQPGFRLYNGRHDYTICMGYSEEPLTEITLTFSDKATYTAEDIYPVCLPMDGYDERVRKLSELEIASLEVKQDRVDAVFEAPREKWLCFAVPYSAGWHCMVDGEETELLPANRMHMACRVGSGVHEVSLRYRTPFLRAGAGISGMALLAFLLLVCRREKGAGNRKTDEERTDGTVTDHSLL